MKHNKLYLVEAHGYEWHRTILITADKNAAIHLAKTHECECGCQVMEHEVGALDSGKKVYPTW